MHSSPLQLSLTHIRVAGLLLLGWLQNLYPNLQPEDECNNDTRQLKEVHNPKSGTGPEIALFHKAIITDYQIEYLVISCSYDFRNQEYSCSSDTL